MAEPSSIADIIRQAAGDVAAGKLMRDGKKHKGEWDGKGVSGLRGTPQGIVPYTCNRGYDTDYTGFLSDGSNLLLFYVNDNPTLASLLKIAEQNKEPVTVGGKLNSTDQKMYELEITSASFGRIELRW